MARTRRAERAQQLTAEQAAELARQQRVLEAFLRLRLWCRRAGTLA